MPVWKHSPINFYFLFNSPFRSAATEMPKPYHDDAQWICFGFNMMNQIINEPKNSITKVCYSIKHEYILLNVLNMNH